MKEYNIKQNLFEPAHDKTYNKTSAISEDSDHRSVFADRMCLLKPQGYPKSDKREPLLYLWMYRLIRVFAGHTDIIVGFIVRWLICLP